MQGRDCLMMAGLSGDRPMRWLCRLQITAIAYCQGTPLRNEIEARGASRLEEATQKAAEALAQRFGAGAIEGRIRALVIT
jgi:hypothetical protein